MTEISECCLFVKDKWFTSIQHQFMELRMDFCQICINMPEICLGKMIGKWCEGWCDWGNLRKVILRTPIIFVPACTTRAADYYIFGQGFYLSESKNNSVKFLYITFYSKLLSESILYQIISFCKGKEKIVYFSSFVLVF